MNLVQFGMKKIPEVLMKASQMVSAASGLEALLHELVRKNLIRGTSHPRSSSLSRWTFPHVVFWF